ncbi:MULTISPECIES: transglycosylase SLT domain-containing protein [Glaesserella]|nr:MULTISPECIES: transglycosylase SLT domain-containing protein [Glaesserella]
MWKKTLLALCITTTYVWANQTPTTKVWSDAEVQQLKQSWTQQIQLDEKKRQQQRENFLQLESLLQAAERTGELSVPLLQIINQLQSTLNGYPLQEEIAWALLKAKMKANQATTEDIIQFSNQYPNTAKRNKLNQRPIEMLYQQQQFAALLDYSKQVMAEGIDSQCQVLGAQYQLVAEKLQPNPEAEQAGNQPMHSSTEMNQLLAQFETLWLTNETLPSSCASIESYWRDQGLKTAEKIKQKALNLFTQNSKNGIADLALNTKESELAQWLTALQQLVNSPNQLQNFVENQPLAEQNKQIVINAFPKFVKTLSEQTDKPDFSPYQAWAEKWQLTADELRSWKISFINQIFDNSDPIFQLWRDEQLKTLKADHLTERRLRMAIWQKSDLKEWLEILSDEGKSKVEWRYWLAKAYPALQQNLLTELAKERGFYPMLAAQQLGKPYQPTLPQVTPLSDEQLAKFKPELDRITELRHLKRFSQAKLAWVDLLQAVSFEEKIAFSEFALQQDWYDLAVEGTIQAKAWDYLSLRLPNAYSDWFDLNLQSKSVTKTFAMAIARQESAWNFQARSHANALGLMQMLPSTASQTAKNSQLVYSAERDLLDPFKNIMLGTAHLAELNEKYPNNRILIAAAYNAGPHRVTRWLERANGTLAMDEFIASIPFLETRGYVQNVLAYDYYNQFLQGHPTLMMFTKEELTRKY